MIAQMILQYLKFKCVASCARKYTWGWARLVCGRKYIYGSAASVIQVYTNGA